MFLNTLLPSGIGGDAYRLIVMDKQTNLSKKAILQRLVSERASGLYMLMVMTCAMLPFSNVYQVFNLNIMLLIAAIFVISITYFFSIRFLLSEFKFRAIGAMYYSFFVQLTSLMTAFAILYGFLTDIPAQKVIVDYMIIFNLSCIASILPISIGGVGVRELMFVFGASYLPIDSELGVTLSLFYFLIYLLVAISAWGSFFKKEKVNQSE
jgi:uncharacterized membrane protein YbhN (UPF0104 family)